MPNRIPVTAAAASAATIEPTGTCARMGVAAAIRRATTPPAIMPHTPPASVRVAASTRNCHRISRRLAPRALRTPISRVRSVTEIIMMATTPTPPTASPTIESTIITTRSTSVVLFTLSRNFSWDTTAKLFSCPGRSPRATRSATVTSSIACSVVAESVGPTRAHPALPVGDVLHEGAVRQEGLEVVLLAEQAGRRVEHADHGVGEARDPDDASDRVEVPEEPVGELLVDHHDLGGGGVLQRREGAAGIDVAPGDLHPIGAAAAQVHGRGLAGAVGDIAARARVLVQGDERHARHLADEAGVLDLH